jgi:hypothetical protein
VYAHRCKTARLKTCNRRAPHNIRLPCLQLLLLFQQMSDQRTDATGPSQRDHNIGSIHNAENTCITLSWHFEPDWWSLCQRKKDAVQIGRMNIEKCVLKTCLYCKMCNDRASLFFPALRFVFRPLLCGPACCRTRDPRCQSISKGPYVNVFKRT